MGNYVFLFSFLLKLVLLLRHKLREKSNTERSYAATFPPSSHFWRVIFPRERQREALESFL